MVNHKTVTSKIYKTKTFIPQDEQYRHENFCEPIIDIKFEMNGDFNNTSSMPITLESKLESA